MSKVMIWSKTCNGITRLTQHTEVLLLQSSLPNNRKIKATINQAQRF